MPEPSRLVLLEQLPNITPGTKVRFLACVHVYQTETASLLLRNQYPARTSEPAAAVVNIDAILENMDHELLQTGAWLNIIGHLRKPVRKRGAVSRKAVNASEAGVQSSKISVVEATMIWSAGAILLDRYGEAVEAYQQSLPTTG